MRRIAFFAILQSLLAAAGARAQTVTATVPSGSNPIGVAVNLVTNKIYVANYLSDNVTVIDGATNTTTTVAAGTGPVAAAVNPVTNKIYVANQDSDNVTVIDAATNATATVPVGTYPRAVAVNPTTNKIYVANYQSANVTVIDGATNTTTTVATGTNPSSVAVNPATNKIYVPNATSFNVTVIDGATNATTTVAAGLSAIAVAVNPITNKIYVANFSQLYVTVIDGATDTPTNVGVGAFTSTVAVNPVSNKIYFSDQSGNNVIVLDGVTNATTTVPLASSPHALAVNPLTNRIYVGSFTTNTVTVIDGKTNTTKALAIGSITRAMAVNPVTNKAYVANELVGSVAVIDGATNAIATVGVGTTPMRVATNPVTDKIYVVNGPDNAVTVIDGATNATATVAVGTSPVSVAVNPTTDKIYVSNFSGLTVTVIDGATNGTSDVPVGHVSNCPSCVAVNSATNEIYVANGTDNTVTVIDGATNSTAAVAVGNLPDAIAVNEETNQIYVANFLSNNLTVINGASNATTTIAVGTAPRDVAVNEVTNKIYVANSSSDDVTVIDGATNSTTPVAAGSGPFAVAVNELTNRIYVANLSGSSVTVIDGTNNSTTTVAVGFNPWDIAVNSTTNKIYVANSTGNNLTVIDGATNTATTVTDPNAQTPQAVAINAATNRIYVPNGNSDNVTVISEQDVQTIPLQAAITPLSGDTTTDTTPTFDFTASSSFTPIAPAPNGLYFQVDTWQGEWQAALDNGGGNFSGTLPALLQGFHILYAYATDGQDATSTNTGSQGSLLISNITAYGFTVSPAAAAPAVTLAPTSWDFGELVFGISNAIKDVTLTNTGTATLNITSIAVQISTSNTTPSADFFEFDTDCGASLNAGEFCTISIYGQPSAFGPLSGVLVVSTDAPGSPHDVPLTATGISAAIASGVPASLDFGSVSVGSTSTPQTITLTNSGSGTLGITSITATGDFGQSNNCPGNLAIGASCTIDVTFSPSSAGSHSEMLTIEHNATGSPTVVTLTGMAVVAGPAVVAAIPIASNSAFAVDVNSNTNQIYTSGGWTSGQVVTWIDGNTNTVVKQLGTGTDAHVNPMTNRIYAAGVYDGNIHVYSGTDGSLITSIAGFGCPIGVDVDVSANRIWGVGQCGSLNDPVFTMDGTTDTLTSGYIGTGEVNFLAAVNPVTHFLYVNALKVDPASQAVTVAPFGSGVDSVNPTPSNNRMYGRSGSNNVAVIDGATETVTGGLSVPSPRLSVVNPVRNRVYIQSGTTPANIYVFDATSNALIGTLPFPSEYAMVDGLAVNTSTGALYAIGQGTGGGYFLLVLTDDLATPAAGGEVTLSSTALTLPGTPLNFTCLPRTVTVTNTGSGPLTFTSITSSSAEFTQTNNCPVAPATLAAGSSCTVTVVFHPAALGTRTGTLTITDNAPTSPQTVAMTGEGLPVCNLAAVRRSLSVLRGTDSAAFEIYHDTQCSQQTAGPDPLTLACVDAQPLSCAFHPQVITLPEHSRLEVTGLKGLGGSSRVWEIAGTSATEHRTLQLAVQFADFWFAASRKQIAMSAGMTAHYALSIVPTNGAAGRMKLSCSGVPRGASCTITPSEVELGGSPVQVQVAVRTSKAGVAPLGWPNHQQPVQPWGMPALMWLLWGLLLAATGLAVKRKQARLGLGVALLWMLAWAGCGGGGGMSPMATGPTPSGTYTLVVTGTLDATGSSVVVDPSSPTLSHDIQLTLNVN